MLKLYDVTDEKFRKYGRIVKNIDFTELVAEMKKFPIPEAVEYTPSISELESLDVAGELSRVYYGEMPIQIGCCNGHNNKLNAVEYHRSSEINVAITDAVLMLGLQADVTDEYTYDTNKIEMFKVPEGMAVEVFATTLHYAPCSTSEEGFKVAIVLPEKTNYPLDSKHMGGEDAILTAKNKWLIGHEEAGLPEGSHIGLIGENLTLTI